MTKVNVKLNPENLEQIKHMKGNFYKHYTRHNRYDLYILANVTGAAVLIRLSDGHFYSKPMIWSSSTEQRLTNDDFELLTNNNSSKFSLVHNITITEDYV